MKQQDFANIEAEKVPILLNLINQHTSTSMQDINE